MKTEPMKWRKITLTAADGTACDLPDLPANENASAKVTATPLANGRGYYYTLTANLPQGFAGENSVVLQPDLPDTGDYLSIAYHSEFWCRPQWGASFADLNKRTHEVLVRRGENDYVCYLVLIGDTFKTLLRGNEEGLEVYVFSNFTGLTECREQPMLVEMTGSDPMALLCDIAAAVPGILGNGLKMRDERRVSPIFDLFGWCSWDAFQYRVSHQGLLQKAREFAEKGVPVGFAIIDDMWADAPHLNEIELNSPEKGKSKLRNFKGDPVRFPQDMGPAIADLKAAGIPHVGIWFPTVGYWAGLDPDGDEAKKQADRIVPAKTRHDYLVVKPEREAAEGMFNDYCGRIRSWGADFVKIDDQSFHYWYKEMAPIGQSALAIQPVIDQVAMRDFDGAIINCMGMASESMYNRRDTAVCRCSDDFIPESPEWFAKNILQCSYNGLLQGRYYVNDWDMWWTDDEQAAKNSLCRAVSGGPIYVSDKVDRTRPEVLRPLMLRDGRILRGDESATPTVDCFFENPTLTDRPFKIRNRVGKCAVLAAFNINAEGRAVSGTASPADALLPAGDYIWYEYFTKTSGRLGAGESVPVSLATKDDFRLFTFLPAAPVVPVGRTDLYMGVKAATAFDGRTLTLVEGGEVSVWSEKPLRVSVNGQPVAAVRTGDLTRFTVPADVREVVIE